MKNEKLVKNIILTLSIFYLFQVIVYSIVLGFTGETGIYNILFYCISFFSHMGITIFLITKRDTFVIKQTGKQLDHINVANLVTLIRFSSVPTLTFFIILSKKLPILPIIVIMMGFVFITDLLDGYISRKAKQTTEMGQMLDSISDYTILFWTAIGLVILQYLPLWFFVLFIFRLVFQASGQLVLLLMKRKITTKPTIFGKITIASTMMLFGCEVFKLVNPDFPILLYTTMEIIVATIIGFSIFDKLVLFIKTGIESQKK